MSELDLSKLDKATEPHLYFAAVLRFKRDSERGDMEAFLAKVNKDEESRLHALTWGPEVDAAVETAAKIEAFTQYIDALERQPDSDNPVPADSETPHERVERVTAYIAKQVLRGAYHPSQSTSENGNLARRAKLSALAEIHEVLVGLDY